MKTVSLIMAGGSGTRFWPLSRISAPKQVQALNGKDTMLNLTVKRLEKFTDLNNIFIITNPMQTEIIKNTIPKELPTNNVLTEPAARNTAPCILYSAYLLNKIYGNCVMTVFPADHYIKDENNFANILKAAIDAAVTTDGIITIGIKPTFPATGYGYIEASVLEQNNIKKVDRFVEKPCYEKAVEYLNSENFSWNSGIFIWQTETILKSFKKYMPDMFKAVEKLFEFYGTANFQSEFEKVYPVLDKISVDYAILEKADNVFVIEGNFGWSDIGSWHALNSVVAPDGNNNVICGETAIIDSKNCVFYTQDRLISAVGVDNLVVVVTKDAIMVCDKNDSERVKEITEYLKNNNMEKYL